MRVLRKCFSIINESWGSMSQAISFLKITTVQETFSNFAKLGLAYPAGVDSLYRQNYFTDKSLLLVENFLNMFWQFGKNIEVWEGSRIDNKYSFMFWITFMYRMSCKGLLYSFSMVQLWKNIDAKFWNRAFLLPLQKNYI